MCDGASTSMLQVRSLVRMCVTVVCFLLFGLLLFQDITMYVQTLSQQRDTILGQGHERGLANDDADVTHADETQRYRFNKRFLTATNDTAETYEPEQLDYERFRLRKQDSVHERIDHSKNTTTYCGQDARKALMARSCQWLKDSHSPFANVDTLKANLTYKMLLVDDVRKVIYCEVPKIACTSWKVLFAQLTGKVEPKDYVRLQRLVHDTTYHPKIGFKFLSQYSASERQYRLENYYKFVVARNPYSRLISAWKNKFYVRSVQSKWYQDHVGTYIIKKYRTNPSNYSLSTGRDVSFDELVRFVGDTHDTSPMRFDAHWWNIHSICHPCLVHYDNIAKLETLEEDLDSILEHISPGEKLTLPYLNANTKSKAIAEQNKIQTFFENVSEVDLARLNQLYSSDLKSFGYNMVDNSLECSLNYHH